MVGQKPITVVVEAPKRAEYSEIREQAERILEAAGELYAEVRSIYAQSEAGSREIKTDFMTKAAGIIVEVVSMFGNREQLQEALDAVADMNRADE